MPASILEPPAVAPADPPTPVADPEPATEPAPAAKPKDVLIIDYSGDLEKVWATMILASTSAAMGVKTRVFVTFWGLPVFVKDDHRITGQTWMQKMLAVMERPGISHRKLSRLDFFGMGPWMMRSLAKRYGVAGPKELLEAAQALGVEFIPCQMTMEMFGLTPDDMIEGMAEPVGAATVIGLMTEDSVPLFI
jgi:peroxiredoxin family protein